MKYSFKDMLLVTSCLVVALAASHPLMSVKRGASSDDEKDVNSQNSMSLKKTKQKETHNEEVKTSPHNMGGPEFMKKFFKNDPAPTLEEQDQLIQFLKVSTYAGNESALEKLYLFSQFPVPIHGIQRTNQDEAQRALDFGKKEKQIWALKIQINEMNKELIELEKSLIKEKNLKLMKELEKAWGKKNEALSQVHLQLTNQGYVGSNSEEFLNIYFKTRVNNISNYFKQKNKNIKEDECILNIASLFYHGEEVEKNLPAAVYFFRKAAKMGNLEGAYNLGLCYINGHGIKEDAKEAIKWFKEAAQQGHSGAMGDLALAYVKGQGVEKDFFQGVEWYEKAEKAGNHNTNVMRDLGIFYTEGKVVPQNKDKGFAYLKKAVGDVGAIGYLFSHYIEKLEKNEVKRLLNVCEKLANSGNAEAIHTLGSLYWNGNGVNQDYKQAFEYFRIGAQNRYPSSIHDLGVCYLQGAGVQKNLVKAIKYLQQAAELGVAQAMHTLGTVYWNRDDIPRDGKKALAYFEKAAKLGVVASMYNIGFLLNLGFENVEPNPEAAVFYFLSAAKEGHAEAMLKLFLYYSWHVNNKISEEYEKDNLASAAFWLLKFLEINNEKKSKGAEKLKDSSDEEDKKLVEHLHKIEDAPLEISIEKKGMGLNNLFSNISELNIAEKEEETSSSDEELLQLIQDVKIEETSTKSEPKVLTSSQERTNDPERLHELLKDSRKIFEKKKHAVRGLKIKTEEMTQNIVQILKNPLERWKIELNDLRTLFSDPYFKAMGRVEIKKTKNGFAIIAENYKTMNFATTGTHKKHGVEKYKGDIHPEVLKDILKILEIFGL